MATLKFKESWDFPFMMILVSMTLIVTAEATTNDEIDTRVCVPLSQCEELKWLQQNLDSHPVLSRQQIQAVVRSAYCGLVDGRPMVKCHMDDEVAAPASMIAYSGYTDFMSRDFRAVCVLKLWAIHRQTNEILQPISLRNRYAVT